ncbi:MAG: GTPase HflX [Bacteroidota bacterium]|nr:GTPase HflX [Bacteroidota bacterium]MEC8967982.1 GTPase HflX [Bacteroidota bacterium]
MISTSKPAEKAVLIGLISSNQNESLTLEYLDELDFLTQTSGAKVVNRFVQRLDLPHPSTFVGKGKINEIKQFVYENEIDIAVFDDDLSPTQIRNVERILCCKILDRSNLILDIFASRARTAHSKVQVELAQYQYLLPRLTRMWTHLERQKGGIGMRGPGETQIETDRRIIGQKISSLKSKLTKIDRQKAAQRNNRGAMVRVALVGYTNVGKSTLMNLLAKSEVFAENKLFATLDTTVRKVVIKHLPFLMTDTVGFIRKLPHQLIESFKSTLDEVREADVLVHVIDISHESYEDQYNTVNETLNELLDFPKPTLLVFNKIDNFKEAEIDVLQGIAEHWRAKINLKTVFISAVSKENINQLKALIYEMVKTIHVKRFPYQSTYFNF